MRSGSVRIAQAATSASDLMIDNEIVTTSEGTVYRQRTADSTDLDYTHVTATVTAAGDTTLYTPAVGNAVVVRYLYAIADPAGTAPIITVKLGGQEKYRVFGISKRQRVTGPTNGALVVNLSTAATVAVTVLLEEA